MFFSRISGHPGYSMQVYLKPLPEPFFGPVLRPPEFFGTPESIRVFFGIRTVWSLSVVRIAPTKVLTPLPWFPLVQLGMFISDWRGRRDSNPRPLA